MKKIFISVLLSAAILLPGCIKHSDQQLNRSLRTKNTAANTNFKRMTPNLMVNDVNSTVRFYKEVLSFEPVVTVPDTGMYDFAIISNGNVEIMLQRKENMEEDYPVMSNKPAGGTFTLNFEVKDIVMVYEKAIIKSELVQELHQTLYGTKEFAVKDNNGYILAFSEALRK